MVKVAWLVALGACQGAPQAAVAPPVQPAPVSDTLERVGGELRWCHDGACGFIPSATNGELQLASLAPARDALLLQWVAAEPGVVTTALYEPDGAVRCTIDDLWRGPLTVQWATSGDGPDWIAFGGDRNPVVYDDACHYVGIVDFGLGLVLDQARGELRRESLTGNTIAPARQLAASGTLERHELPSGSIRGEASIEPPSYCTLDGTACHGLDLGAATDARWLAERSPNDHLWRVDLGDGEARRLALVGDDGTVIYQDAFDWRWDVTWAAGDTTFASTYAMGCNCGATWILAPTGEQTRFGYAALAPDGASMVELPTGLPPGGAIAEVTLRTIPSQRVTGRRQVLGITGGCTVEAWRRDGAAVRCATTGGDVMVELP